MIRNFDELLQRAGENGRKRLVVAAAGDRTVLEAVRIAMERELIEPVLVGERAKISLEAEKVGLHPGELEIVAAEGPLEACSRAVKLVSSGQGDILMKGHVDSAVILKEVLNSEYGLRSSRVISHISLLEAGLIGRLLFITDGGMNIKPDLKTRKEIVENAVEVAHKLGYKNPRVALLAAVERVNPDMPETVEAAALAKMAERGQIKGASVDGPMAIDLALSEEAARIKGFESPVAGKADILVVPEIVSGNLLGKAPTYLSGDRMALIIGGCTRPMVLTSRASNADIKLVSIAATVLMASG